MDGGRDPEITAFALTAMVEEFAGRWFALGRTLGTTEIDQLTALCAGALVRRRSGGPRGADVAWSVAIGHLRDSASTEIDAPLEEVWAVVQEVMAAPEWHGGLEKMTALERDADGRATLVETVNDIKGRRVRARVRIRYEGPTRLTWTQEEGDMKSAEACLGARGSRLRAHAR